MISLRTDGGIAEFSDHSDHCSSIGCTIEVNSLLLINHIHYTTSIHVHMFHSFENDIQKSIKLLVFPDS